jgi:tol-pal system protein YbgF
MVSRNQLCVWLLLMALSGLVPFGTSQAQRPRDNELVLELLDRVERLEEEVRSMRGEMEIQRHQIEELLQEQQLSTTRSPPPAETPERAPTARVAPVVPERPALPPAAGPTPAPVPSSPAVASVQPPVASVQPSIVPVPSVPGQPSATSVEIEQTAFNKALNEFREGRYPEAIAGFQRFLNTYQSSQRAGEAQYWLAEAHYVSRDYAAAKDAFIGLGLHYPQSNRLPDALLKLGYIYGDRGDTERAREVLEKLVQDYPNTQAASLGQRRLQSLR